MANSKKIEMDTIIKQSSTILSQQLDDDTVIANIETGHYFGIDTTAKYIWEQLATPTTLRQICLNVINDYDVDEVTCNQQVHAFVQKLVDQDLLSIENSEL